MSQTVLGFDYGRRKIGIAVGQTSTGFAEGIATIPANAPAGPWLKIEKLIESRVSSSKNSRVESSSSKQNVLVQAFKLVECTTTYSVELSGMSL